METPQLENSRVTFVASDPARSEILWSRSATANRLLFLDSIDELRLAIDFAISENDFEAERVILERGSAEEFLNLLAQIPREFLGDIVMLRDDRSGYLSAIGRGGDRSLQLMTPVDVGFYLEISRLVGSTPSESVAA